jgi:ferredoxin-type protein NapF
VDDSCLSRRSVVCRLCEDACDAAAIRFRLAVGGAAQPWIDPARCTGCGACVAVCPAGSVEMAGAGA